MEAQVPDANYDESKVVVENLPDVLQGRSGKRLDSAEAWPGHRDFLVEQLAQHVYGHAPTIAQH